MIELVTYKTARIGYDTVTYSHCEYLIDNDKMFRAHIKLVLSTVCPEHLDLVEAKPIFKNNELKQFKFILPLCKL